ncbi:MAG: hypothetical protein LBH59_01970, partial [Planctomycetaceae bacterium]|nr:hypothetical protein [Planctomycetaceae bacterium]
MTISNRSRRIMQGNNKPTLLPFLAVLLCTTGALILLLVLIARDVRDSEILPKKNAGKQLSEQTMPVISEINPTQDLDDTKKIISVSEVKETLENLESDIAEAEWMATQFAESKNELDKQLANAEAYLASVEKQTVQLREEIKRLIELAQKMEQDNNNQQKIDIKSLEQLLQQKNAERELAEKRLAELQKELKENKKSYAIVPYRGTNGTFRLPVYVECKEDKVIIQPEGIELSMYDFLALDRADNPFDSLLRVARQYYAETGQIERGSEPYPLIIIRPSGVRAFGAAHAAIGNWLKDFGYELVAEDWKMEYPQQNDELRQRMEKQLIVSRQRLQGYVATMRAKNGSGYSHGTGNNKPNEPNNTAEHAGQNNPPINVTNNPNQFNNGNGNGSGNGTREYTISDGVVREVDNS